MKSIRELAIGGLLIAGSCLSAAQAQIAPDGSDGALPPQLSVEISDEMSDLPPAESLPGESLPAESLPAESSPQGRPLSGGSGASVVEESTEGAPLPMRMEEWGVGESLVNDCSQNGCGATSALLESSGSWLRRGFWYTELDAILFNRTWARNGVVLGLERFAPDNFFGVNVAADFPFSNRLILGHSKPGVEGLPRLTLGTFLFRDGRNRDHNAEFTWFGAGEFQQRGELQAVGAGGLQVVDLLDRNLIGGPSRNPSFDGARFMSFDFNHVVDSFEFNYLVKERMQRDRMALQPSGEWVRQANPSRTKSFLVGLRYINLREEFDWLAEGIPDPGANNANTAQGDYAIDVDNNLLGTQIGGSIGYEADRWSLILSGKIGGYWNQLSIDSAFSNTGADGTDLGSGDTVAEADRISSVGQAALTGRWHIRPNSSLRAGLELFWIDGLALSPSQINFIPGSFPMISQDDDSVYMGLSLGWETYW